MRFKSLALAAFFALAPLAAQAACPQSLPPAVNYTAAGVKESDEKIALTQMRDYLNCLLGAAGDAVTAKSTLGLAPVATSGSYADLTGVPTGTTGLVPAGTIFAFAAGGTPPTGYVLCAGQAISRAGNPGLFAVIGGSYGAGDGSTTFNVPDLRGRFIAGSDVMGGVAAGRLGGGATGGIPGTASFQVTGGQQYHVQTIGELVQHSHTASSASTPSLSVSGGSVILGSVTAPGSGIFGAVQGFSDFSGFTTIYPPGTIGGSVVGSVSTTTSVAAAGSSAASNITPPVMVLHWIIKTELLPATLGSTPTGLVG